MADRLLFPPTTVADMRQRGWDAPDFVYVSGDAYVDHPSFGAAVIVRTLEAAGYHVAVLAQPNWKNANDFKRFGRPNYGFLVSSGVIDSMVNHYTAAKRRRSSGTSPSRMVYIGNESTSVALSLWRYSLLSARIPSLSVNVIERMVSFVKCS